MDRKFEFRIWGKCQKPPCFIDLKEFKIYGRDVTFYDILNGIIFNNSSTYVVQRFTGRVDKNGRKIFEGDLVKCFDNSVQEVQFFDDDGFFGYKPYEYSYILPESEFIEIKGNIFEP